MAGSCKQDIKTWIKQKRGPFCQLTENYQFKIFPAYGQDFCTKRLLCFQTNITETVNDSEIVSDRINMVGVLSMTGLNMGWSSQILKFF